MWLTNNSVLNKEKIASHVDPFAHCQLVSVQTSCWVLTPYLQKMEQDFLGDFMGEGDVTKHHRRWGGAINREPTVYRHFTKQPFFTCSAGTDDVF